MTAAPIAFRSNPGRYSFEGVAQIINGFAEQRGPDAKAPLSVLPHDGVSTFVDTGSGPCRGFIFLEDLDALYSIHSSSAYKVTYDRDTDTATATRIGTVPGIDPVQLSRNQNASPQIAVRANGGTQIIWSDSLQYILDADYPSDVVTVDYVNGYTLAGQSDRTWYISGINDTLTWDALDFATFQQRAGKLLRIIENSGEVVGLCSTWMEFWRDTGNADFPFQPIGFRTRGIKASGAVCNTDNTFMWVGDDNVIYRANNYDPLRISTHAVERLVQDDGDPDSIIAFSQVHGGHSFANFKGDGWTRCYDSATGVWNTRESYARDNWRMQYAVNAWGKTIVGDSESGKLGVVSSDTYTEFDDIMVWGVDSPPLHAFPNGGIVDAVHFDLATGYGTLSGQGSNPKIMLQVSKDGGNTFGQYRELELGIQGKYATRVTARRLGRFGPKGIVFRLRISDPVARALVGSDVEVRPLKR
jgi:hypothetical protein